MLSGIDPDFHRRDLYDAIEAGAFPEWELGIQVVPGHPGGDLRRASTCSTRPRSCRRSSPPVQPVGKLMLNRTPTNFFAETEQVAFHLGHLPPGIDVTNDPLLQGRLFSYVDTQLTRLGGPNFGQIPINRPHAPVNDMLRDGFHQQAVHAGVAPYRPNSLDGGNPFAAGDAENAFVDVPVTVAEATKVRANPASFDDHFSQARLFWLSMTPVGEGAHHPRLHLRARQVLRAGDQGTPAAVPGQHRPGALPPRSPPVWACRRRSRPCRSPRSTPEPGAVAGRRRVAARRPDGRHRRRPGRRTSTASARCAQTVFAAGMVPLLIAPHGGMVGDLPVQRTFATARSVEFDALLLAGRAGPGPGRAARPRRQGRRRRLAPPWTRGCCCWSTSAGGTPRRSAPGAPAPPCWSRPASPARRASSSARTPRRSSPRSRS